MNAPGPPSREWFTTAFGAHYTRLYRHRDEAEARACVEVLDALQPLGPGPVLDLGCGAGRHLPFLADRGVTGLGLDLSAPLLAEAARVRADAAPGFALARGDMRVLPLSGASVTGVLSLFTAFGYFGPLSAHRDMVAEVARVLRPGGHWYLDYLNAARVRRELARGPDTRRRELGPCAVVETRALGPDGATVRKRVAMRPLPGREREAADAGVPAAGLDYTEEVALFAVRELDALAAGSGLRRIAAAGGYDGAAFDEDRSDRWILVYRREGDGA